MFNVEKKFGLAGLLEIQFRIEPTYLDPIVIAKHRSVTLRLIGNRPDDRAAILIGVVDRKIGAAGFDVRTARGRNRLAERADRFIDFVDPFKLSANRQPRIEFDPGGIWTLSTTKGQQIIPVIQCQW